MWFLRDIGSGENVSPDFSSQAKLARFMQILPQTLHKAIQEGRNIFKFRERNVRVGQEKIPQWALYSSSGTERASGGPKGTFGPSETPIETFETMLDLAKWLKVTKQAVYAAINRGLEPQIKNKEGTVFLLRKFEEGEGGSRKAADSPRPAPVPAPVPALVPAPVTAPVPAPRKKNLPSALRLPPVPAPRKKNLPSALRLPPVPAPRKKNLPSALRLPPVPAPPPRKKNLPPSREISPVLLLQNESEERQQRIAEIQRKNVGAPKDGEYEEDMRKVEELLRQKNIIPP